MRPEGITQSQWRRYNFYLAMEHVIGIKNSEKYLRSLKNKLYQQILQNPGIQTRGKVYTNKDVECNDYALITDREFLMQGPLLFKGAAKNWPCTTKWDKEFFRKHFSDYGISLVGNPGLVEKVHEGKYTETNLGNFIDTFIKDKDNYLRFSRIIDENPELKKDVDMAFLEQFKSKLARGGYSYLFMGAAGSKTSMHNAIIHTLFYQVKGKKKWTIYAPNERIFVDAIADRRPYFYSHADPNNLNDPKFPLLKYAKRYEIVMDEGDVMWFPTFYWHYVENLSPSIGVTYKFTEFGSAFKVSKMLTTLFFLATKPTLLESFYYNMVKGKDLLFEKH